MSTRPVQKAQEPSVFMITAQVFHTVVHVLHPGHSLERLFSPAVPADAFTASEVDKRFFIIGGSYVLGV